MISIFSAKTCLDLIPSQHTSAYHTYCFGQSEVYFRSFHTKPKMFPAKNIEFRLYNCR